MPRPFRKTRLAYLEELEEEYGEEVRLQDPDKWITASDIYSDRWTPEFVRFSNETAIHRISSSYDGTWEFNELNYGWWENKEDHEDPDFLKCDPNSGRPLWPSRGWGIYLHPGLRLIVILSDEGSTYFTQSRVRDILNWVVKNRDNKEAELKL